MYHSSKHRPEELEGGLHTGPELLGGRVYRFSLLASGPRNSGLEAHRPEELEGGVYGHSSIHSSFPPGPKAGLPVRLTVVPGQRLSR